MPAGMGKLGGMGGNMQTLKKILEEIDIKVAGSMGKKREGLLEAQDIIRKHMNDGWIPVEERSPAGYERIGYDKIGNKYMRRLEIAYMTDTIEYVHGYYDGYKWMDKWYDIIENVVAWKIHEPYRPERSEK